MDEFSFINAIKPNNYKQASLIKGLGDDAAVFRQPYQDVVTAVDTFVENVHFSRETMEPFHIGYRALAANISDMAAMGCSPAFYLISMVIPKHWQEEELKGIYKGLQAIASQHEMDLIGGDTVAGKELVISVTILGFLSQTKGRYRSDAKEGDIVFITGTLGDSLAGYHILTDSDLPVITNKQYFIDKHRMPTPRVAFAKELQQLTRVSLNDISDGIGNEAAEIAEASQASIYLHYEKLPYTKELELFSEDLQRQWKLFGGEDFELVGTASKDDWPFIVNAAKKTNTKVSKIGYVEEKELVKGKVFLLENNHKTLLKKSGYTHLK